MRRSISFPHMAHLSIDHPDREIPVCPVCGEFPGSCSTVEECQWREREMYRESDLADEEAHRVAEAEYEEAVWREGQATLDMERELREVERG